MVPTEINIYESHTPTQVSRVEVVDMQGIYHEVYTAEPKMVPDCPYGLSVPIQGVDYQVVSVKITIDQSVIGLPWDEIDAVELVGYTDTAVAGEGQDLMRKSVNPQKRWITRLQAVHSSNSPSPIRVMLPVST